MNSKIKLKIRFKNTFDYLPDNIIPLDRYYLYIKVLEKDERFKVTIDKQFVDFKSKRTNMFISAYFKSYYGCLLENRFCLPAAITSNIELKLKFETDQDRYIYMKRLYIALVEWANNWKGFQEDKIADIFINENIWDIHTL
jgi:hypothetical protein